MDRPIRVGVTISARSWESGFATRDERQTKVVDRQERHWRRRQRRKAGFVGGRRRNQPRRRRSCTGTFFENYTRLHKLSLL